RRNPRSVVGAPRLAPRARPDGGSLALSCCAPGPSGALGMTRLPIGSPIRKGGCCLPLGVDLVGAPPSDPDPIGQVLEAPVAEHREQLGPFLRAEGTGEPLEHLDPRSSGRL